jgi:transcriptional regulator of arginine metabolism
MDQQAATRRDLIRQLLRTERVGTQEELAALLARKGVLVTQATLSRDLARLRARRVTLPEGGSVYELEDRPAPAAHATDALGELRTLVSGVEHNGSLVVVFTRPGAASAVAMAIDRARMPEVLATIAGDDTIFVAPARKVSAQALLKHLQSLWSQKKTGTH